MKHKIEPGLEVTIRGVEYTIDSVTGKPPVVILTSLKADPIWMFLEEFQDLLMEKEDND